MSSTRSPRVALLEGQAPPRVSHAPKHTHANDWEIVADLSATFGVKLDEWQEVVLQAAMGVRLDGRWSTSQVGLSTPRQNGKSQLIVARALAGILAFEERTIVISAHQQDTAREVFTRLVDLIEAHPTLEARVAERGIMRALNREAIRFETGQVIKFKARSAGGGRGFSCDCLLMDEAQILDAAAWAAIRPTMSARPNAQVWLLGTPPTPQDDGEVFARFRSAGIEGKQSRLAYLEWSADEGDDLDDVEVWAKANPSFGMRISHDAVADERATMSDAQFAMERLGMWSANQSRGVIPGPSWTTQGAEHSLAVDRFALGVECGPDLAWASVAFAGQRADEKWHFELDEDQHTKGRGVEWLVPHLEYLTTNNSQIRAVVVDVGGPVSALLEQRPNGRWYFKGSKLEATPVKVVELGQGCASVLSGIVTGDLHHIGQPQFTAAALSAGKRPLGDTGMWVWSRKTADSDITPIQAGTLALIGAQTANVKKPTRQGGGRRVVTV